MNIRLHIESLSIEGLPVTRSQRAEVREAMEAELTRLMSSGELRRGLSGTLAHLKGESLQVAPGAAAADVGVRIAAATYGSLFEGGSRSLDSSAPGGGRTGRT